MNEIMRPSPAVVIERLISVGDLKQLTSEERTKYYLAVCESVGINPLTKPFDYMTLNGKLVLYATKGCTDQIRNSRKISVQVVSREKIEDIYIVTARAISPDGRQDESTGAVSVTGLRGDILANAYMKAETKAKRRVTLSMCGLGMLDEIEVETIPNKQLHNFDPPQETVKQGSVKIIAPNNPEAKSKIYPTDAQLKRLFAIVHAHGLSNDEIKEMIKKDYKIESSKELTIEQYNELVGRLEAGLGKTEEWDPKI